MNHDIGANKQEYADSSSTIRLSKCEVYSIHYKTL